MSGRAVVLLSGGLDSATCLAVARRDGHEAHALSIDYGQRQRAELDAARRLAKALGAASHRVVAVDLRAIGGSALTDAAIAVPKDRTAIAVEFSHHTGLIRLSIAGFGLAAKRWLGGGTGDPG